MSDKYDTTDYDISKYERESSVYIRDTLFYTRHEIQILSECLNLLVKESLYIDSIVKPLEKEIEKLEDFASSLQSLFHRKKKDEEALEMLPYQIDELVQYMHKNVKQGLSANNGVYLYNKESKDLIETSESFEEILHNVYNNKAVYKTKDQLGTVVSIEK